MAWWTNEVNVQAQTSEDTFSRLAEKFEGKEVRVYLANGAILSGRITFKDGWVEVTEVRSGKSSLCNLNHVISISRM